MSIEDITAEDLGVEPGMSGPQIRTESALDRIRSRRKERSDLLTIDIPSWDGDLKAKYMVLNRTDLERMIRTIRARTKNKDVKGGEADFDFLIKSCVEIVGYDETMDEPEFHLSDGYTMDLVELLQPEDEFGNKVEIRNQHELIAWMFGKTDSSIALASHSVSVARWMQDPSKPIGDPQ